MGAHTTVSSEFDASGNLVFYDKSRNIIFTIDGTNRKVAYPSASAVEMPAGVTGGIVALTGLFTEDATTTTHTMTFTIPAGATLLDILVVPQVLWTDSSAALVVGDANSANGWFTTTELDATDLVIGERLQASNANNWGGVNGAYLTTAGRFGQQSANMIGGYCPSAYSVIGVVTVATPSGTAGRTRMTVLYYTGSTVSPVLT